MEKGRKSIFLTGALRRMLAAAAGGKKLKNFFGFFIWLQNRRKCAYPPVFDGRALPDIGIMVSDSRAIGMYKNQNKFR